MTRLYSGLCEHVLLPLADVLSKRSIAKMLRFLEAAESWSEDELRVYQSERLREVVSYAYQHVDFYRNYLDDHGFRPSDIQSSDDLIRFPVVTKSLLREQGISKFIAPTKQQLIKTTTSGSTGEQGTFYLSKQAESLTYAAVLLFFKWAGFQLGDRHVLTGITSKRGWEKSLKDLLFRCHYVPAFHLSDPDLERIISLIESRRVKFLAGYASSLYCIASYAASNQKSIELDGVISLGDMLFPHYRRKLESAFGCKIHDTYGCCEGFQIAAQCGEMNYHVCMPLTFVEILDDEGRRAPPGSFGRVVLTRLDLNPMPLIRYEVGDVAALSNNESCDCGRKWQLLDAIQGRDTDIIITPNGQRLIVHFFTAIFENETRIKQFQVVQDDLERIRIRVLPAKGFTADVLDKIRRQILQRCRHDLAVTFDIVDNIPPSASGKTRFVISRIQNHSRDTEAPASPKEALAYSCQQ